jgi:hypothetical protein
VGFWSEFLRLGGLRFCVFKQWQWLCAALAWRGKGIRVFKTTGAKRTRFFWGQKNPVLLGPKEPGSFGKNPKEPGSFYGVLFFVLYGDYGVKEDQNHHTNILQKVHVENFSPKKSTNMSMSVFPRFVSFIAFFGDSQRWEFKNTTKNFYKKSCLKVFTKNRQNNPKPSFSRFVLSLFGRFSARGARKHHTKNNKKCV